MVHSWGRLGDFDHQVIPLSDLEFATGAVPQLVREESPRPVY